MTDATAIGEGNLHIHGGWHGRLHGTTAKRTARLAKACSVARAPGAPQSSMTVHAESCREGGGR